MSRRKHFTQPMKLVVLLLIVANAILIEEAYTSRHELYWLLLVSVPLLAWSIVRAKRKPEYKTVKLKEHGIK